MAKVVERELAPKIERAVQKWPSITLTGPRQSGKTTLCRALFPDRAYETLEALDVREFASEDPRGFLAQFPHGAILDEVQRAPELLSYLQEIIDADPAPGRWILTGSQNLALRSQVSQSLAGRTAICELLPLTRGEIVRFHDYPETLDDTLFRGSYPRIFNEGHDPAEWLRSYIGTYIERDLRQFSNVGDLAAFQRFLQLCAGRTAQLLNYSSLARDCGVSQPTAKNWLSILEASYITFTIPPMCAKLSKRLAKSSKLYFYDTGLVCALLGIRTAEQLHTHPLRGFIFETWVASELVKRNANRGDAGEIAFYREQNGAEADLILSTANGTVIVEAKSAATPSSVMLAGAKRVQKHLAQAHGHLPPAVVIFGGELAAEGDK